MSSSHAATRSKPLMTSLMALTNQPGEALLPCGITSHSNSRFGEQNSVKGMVSLSMVIWWNEETKWKREKMRLFPHIIENLVDAGGGKLSEAADVVRLLVVDGDADTAVLLRDGDHGAGVR